MNGFSRRSVGQNSSSRIILTSSSHGGSAIRTRKLRIGSIINKVKIMFAKLFAWFKRPGDRGRFSRRRILTAIFATLFLYVGYLWLTLPVVDDQSIRAAQSTVIADRNGVELYRLFAEQDRTYVSGSLIPQNIKDAVVAIEDERFYTRGCVDLRAIARAVISLGGAGGASTITRQLARNALDLQNENIINRKLKELILGCQLEHTYDREKVLELYLNWIPFGRNAYGIEQASQQFFGKAAKDTNLAEAAVLASLPQMPSYLSPYGQHVRTTVTPRALEKIIDGTIKDASDLSDDDVMIGLLGANIGTGSTLVYVGGRTDQVLHNMEELEFITAAEREEAVKNLETITFAPSRESIRAPHFVLWMKDLAERTFEESGDQSLLEQGGLNVRTTLDWRLQQAAEEIIAARREDISKRFMAQNIALVAADPKTGEVLAYVGNADYNDEEHGGKIDMALAPRQPGSSFKPFVYASAFLEGYGPSTVLYDVPTKFGTYEPQNYEGSFQGLVTARQALGGSRNIPAVKAYFLGGEESKILALTDAMSMPTPHKLQPAAGYGPAMAIGSAEIPLIEMVQGYSVFAAGGILHPLKTLTRITNLQGSLLPLPNDDQEDIGGEEVLDPRVAYEVTSILSDVSVRPGEYWQSVLSVSGFQAAAKTGTSNKCLEWSENGNVCKERRPDNLWTIGYTPSLVVGVWVGNADSSGLSPSADGLSVAAPIWRDFMAKAMKIMAKTPDGAEVALPTSFETPTGIVEPQVSLLSGQLPAECTPIALRRGDVFLQENAPTMADPGCITLTVDKVTGLLSSPECPAEAQEQRSFLVPLSVLEDRFPGWKQAILDWGKTRQPVLTASGAQLVYTPGASGTGAVLPLPFAPTETCKLSLTPGRTVMPTLQILSPTAGGSVSYPSFQPQFNFTVGNRVREILVTIDDKPAARFTQAPFKGYVRVPRSLKEEGTHVMTVTLIDEYYNTVKKDVSFTFTNDTSGPDVFFTEPADGTTFTLSTPITMRATSEDPEGELKYVEFYLDDLLLTRKPAAPFELTYKPNVVMPGEHLLRAVATDVAGNTSEDVVRITIVDSSTAPGTTSSSSVAQ